MSERVALHGSPQAEGVVGAPQPIDPATGMHKDYWILSEAERAKGFVRPVRISYTHIGIPGPKYPLRALTNAELERFGEFEYVKFEKYPEGESSLGRYWTQKELDSIGKGCGFNTRMNINIAETYAREPRFYGSTFCAVCRVHKPVGAQGEFVWEGTSERVGT